MFILVSLFWVDQSNDSAFHLSILLCLLALICLWFSANWFTLYASQLLASSTCLLCFIFSQPRESLFWDPIVHMCILYQLSFSLLILLYALTLKSFRWHEPWNVQLITRNTSKEYIRIWILNLMYSIYRSMTCNNPPRIQGILFFWKVEPRSSGQFISWTNNGSFPCKATNSYILSSIFAYCLTVVFNIRMAENQTWHYMIACGYYLFFTPVVYSTEGWRKEDEVRCYTKFVPLFNILSFVFLFFLIFAGWAR